MFMYISGYIKRLAGASQSVKKQAEMKHSLLTGAPVWFWSLLVLQVPLVLELCGNSMLEPSSSSLSLSTGERERERDRKSVV